MPALFIISFHLVSCLSFKSLHSTTYIKANDEFILGNNVHGKFFVNLTNTSNFEVTIWQYPLAGGRHSPITQKPYLRVKVMVDKNRCLIFKKNLLQNISNS